MNIVVTGSSGLLGAHIAVRLRAQHRVLGIDLIAGPHTDVRCDLRERAEVRLALSRADAIVHTAALHAPHLAGHDEAAFQTSNVAATDNLLDAARAIGTAHFVFTSSTSVYGHALEAPRTVWVDETLAPRPRDAYDRTKLAAEERVAAAAGAMLCTVLRIARCFPEPAATMAAYRLHRGVDRRDVTQAVERALARTSAPAAIGSRRAAPRYVISGPTPFTRSDLDELSSAPAALIRRRCTSDARRFEARSWSLPDRIDRVYSSALAQREIGYRPRFGLTAFLDGDCDPQPLPPRL